MPLDPNMILIGFISHRARENGLRVLGRKPEEYCSYDWGKRRGTAKGGAYAVTPAEYKRLRKASAQQDPVFNMLRFTRVRDRSVYAPCLFGGERRHHDYRRRLS